MKSHFRSYYINIKLYNNPNNLNHEIVMNN